MIPLLMLAAFSFEGPQQQPPSKQATPKAAPIGQNVIHTHRVWLSYNNPPPGSSSGKAQTPAQKPPKK